MNLHFNDKLPIHRVAPIISFKPKVAIGHKQMRNLVPLARLVTKRYK